MIKQKQILFLIAVLATIFTIQLGSNAYAAVFVIKFDWPKIFNGSVCSDVKVGRLGNVTINETIVWFSIFDLEVWYDNDNPAGNSSTAQGTAHIGDTIVVSTEITSGQVEKNGTAEITYLCIKDGDIESAIFNAVLPNDSWTLNDWGLLSFDVKFLLTVEGEENHVLIYSCDVKEDGNFDCGLTYDSRAK